MPRSLVGSSTMSKKPPLTPDEVRERLQDPKLKITAAPQDACEHLGPYVNRILVALRDVAGISGAFVTDETYLSDFLCSIEQCPEDYEALGNALGIPITDNMPLIELAAQLKAKAANRSS